MTNWLINGVIDDRISVTDRGFSYGDGLFETVAVRDGQARFLDAHLDRLLNGAERLDLPAPRREVFIDETAQLATGCEYGTLKIIVTRGTGKRGYAPPVPASPVRILGLSSAERPAPENYLHGVAVRHCATPIGRSPATAGLKTLGRLEQVLARAEWRDTSIAEGLMCTVDGFVVCGTMSNLFLVQDGELVVPDLSTCGVNGVMRRMVLDTANRIGLQWRVVDVPREAVDTADELFVTNSLIGLWPIRRVDNNIRPVGPITRTLMQELAADGVSECAGR